MNAPASNAVAAPAAPAAAAFAHYLAPTSLAQALAALAAHGGATVLAGGSDLMPQLHARRLHPAATLLSIRRVPALDTVQVSGGTLRLGTLTPVATLLTHPLVQAHAPLLRQAADHFASDQIRNAATVGGNLCNASPAGDLLTPLLALDAVVELASLAADGSVALRAMPVHGFFIAPGRTRRQSNELLTAVQLPLAAPGQQVRFYKTGTRPALDISTISIAFAAQRDAAGRLRNVRLAFGALGPTPLRALRTEALLDGQTLDAELAARAGACAATEVTPIDDVRASAWYRLELVRNMTRRMLDDAAHA